MASPPRHSISFFIREQTGESTPHMNCGEHTPLAEEHWMKMITNVWGSNVICWSHSTSRCVIWTDTQHAILAVVIILIKISSSHVTYSIFFLLTNVRLNENDEASTYPTLSVVSFESQPPAIKLGICHPRMKE